MNRMTRSTGVLCALIGFGLGYQGDAPAVAPAAPVSSDRKGQPVQVSTVSTSAEQSGDGGKSSKPLALTLPSLDTPFTSIKEIMAYPSYAHRNCAMRAYFERLPLAQFSGLLTDLLKNSYEHRDAARMLLMVWAERAPEQGARELDKLPSGWLRQSGSGMFFQAWGRIDRDAARKWCQENLQGLARYRALQFNEGVPQTKEAILAMSDAASKEWLLGQLFGRKAFENRPAALAEALQLPDQDRKFALSSIVERWSQSDPLSALLWLKAQKAEALGNTENLESTALRQLAKNDPLAAKKFIANLPPGGRRNGFMDEAATALLKDDVPAAIAYFDEIKAQDPAAIPESFFAKWLSLDPDRASEKLRESLNKNQPTEWILQGIFNPWMSSDPGAVARFSVTLPENVQATVLKHASRFWVDQNAAEAAQWAQSLSEGKARDDAMRLIASQWSQYDTLQSSQWLKSLPQNAGRWAATEGIVNSMIDDNPDAALKLVRSISNEDQRLQVLSRTWKKWSEQNKPSAEDWLKNSGLSEVERQAITPPPPQ